MTTEQQPQYHPCSPYNLYSCSVCGATVSMFDHKNHSRWHLSNDMARQIDHGAEQSGGQSTEQKGADNG